MKWFGRPCRPCSHQHTADLASPHCTRRRGNGTLPASSHGLPGPLGGNWELSSTSRLANGCPVGGCQPLGPSAKAKLVPCSIGIRSRQHRRGSYKPLLVASLTRVMQMILLHHVLSKNIAVKHMIHTEPVSKSHSNTLLDSPCCCHDSSEHHA
jgi:hypothetical protein